MAHPQMSQGEGGALDLGARRQNCQQPAQRSRPRPEHTICTPYAHDDVSPYAPCGRVGTAATLWQQPFVVPSAPPFAPSRKAAAHTMQSLHAVRHQPMPSGPNPATGAARTSFLLTCIAGPSLHHPYQERLPVGPVLRALARRHKLRRQYLWQRLAARGFARKVHGDRELVRVQ